MTYELRNAGALVAQFATEQEASVVLTRLNRCPGPETPCPGCPDHGWTVEPGRRWHVLHGGSLVDTHASAKGAEAHATELRRAQDIVWAKDPRPRPPIAVFDTLLETS